MACDSTSYSYCKPTRVHFPQLSIFDLALSLDPGPEETTVG